MSTIDVNIPQQFRFSDGRNTIRRTVKPHADKFVVESHYTGELSAYESLAESVKHELIDYDHDPRPFLETMTVNGKWIGTALVHGDANRCEATGVFIRGGIK